MIDITTLDELKGLVASDLLLVDYHAKWCAPCKGLGLVLSVNEADINAAGARIVKVDIDDAESDLLKIVGVRAVPTMALFSGSLEPLSVKMGMLSRDQIIGWISDNRQNSPASSDSASPSV